ncbi:MAG: type II toxin-antitoxin system HicA family toxin [Gammaproteobacteria bacterium]|nr:type II toxin-antitoxin system HicA family toxin [Gammaproteobacteria bacterium]
MRQCGGVLVRHGAKHDWYRNPETGVSQPVPRHREIKDRLAKHIVDELSRSSGATTGERRRDED